MSDAFALGGVLGYDAAETGFRWQSFSYTLLFALDGIDGVKGAI